MTSKIPLEIIYSRQMGDYAKGKVYSNPRFFTTPRAGVTKVYLVGHWPKVEAAYLAAGVPVEHVEDERNLNPPIPPTADEVIAANAPHLEVEIPENWRELPWVAHHGELSIRAVAGALTDGAVLNKAQAVAVITAELARREGV